MASEADENPLPMRAVLQAEDVVAAGRVENVLQVPSPIYTAEFTDPHHVLIGAGGGGRKFGMANIALLLRVQSLRVTAPPTLTSPAAKNVSTALAAPSPSASRASAVEPPVWAFAAAIDLGVDIPWCTSAFLPFHDAPAAAGSATDPVALSWSDKQRAVLQELDGFLALSSITSFTLIGVYRGVEPTTAQEDHHGGEEQQQQPQRYLRQLARIAVPHDEKDPDKKPIALTQNLLLVAHDSNGVLAFALADLVPDSLEDEDEHAYRQTYAAQVKPGRSLQRRVPRVVTAAAPVAEWKLPARVNDLSVNRVCIVQAEATPGAAGASTAAQPCKAHLHEYLVLAALLQNKTVVLSTLRVKRKYGSKSKGADKSHKHGDTSTLENGGAPSAMETAQTLTGSELPLPFKLLTSSLRLVRVFGWNNIDAAQQAEMHRRLTWQSLQEGGAPTHGPLCSLMLVAFNTHASESFLIHGAVDVTHGGSNGALTLQLRWAQPQPTPVLRDAITAVAVCADKVPADYEARLRRSPVGAAVPIHFLVGTVEGWVASLRWDSAERRWRSDHVRPSPLKSVANRFPALHKEPVSCVAVSAENDVVSADIAQNVAVTAVPYAVRDSSDAHRGPADGSSVEETPYVVLPRLATASPLFPTSMAEAGLFGWVVAMLTNGAASNRVVLFLAVPLLLLFMAVALMMR